ncbi:hypothetical protein J2736_001459 [Paenibacillus qinlingensis]|uniref:Uncharacterized protein n=1 Tax=Paenibacillus qinlingensis TaxID=1837343 RepID=A0ABU1NS27_9BACL|nr:hypothetical protein [Paenibacillus qinlingensis]
MGYDQLLACLGNGYSDHGVGSGAIWRQGDVDIFPYRVSRWIRSMQLGLERRVDY